MKLFTKQERSLLKAFKYTTGVDADVQLWGYKGYKYKEYSYSDFRLDYSTLELVLKTHDGYVGRISCCENTELIRSLAKNYPEVEEIYAEFLMHRTMLGIAGEELPYIVDRNIKEVNKITREELLDTKSITNILTDFGNVKVEIFSKLFGTNVITNSEIVNTPPDEITTMIPKEHLRNNLVFVVPLYFHSLEVVNGKIKIWVVCSLMIEDVTTIYGRLPITYCDYHSKENKYDLTISTAEGCISLVYELIRHLDSSFTFEEVFDVVPTHATVFREILIKSMKEFIV